MGFTATSYKELAPGVARLRVLFVNTYFIDAPGGWILLDTGLPGSATLIRHAAEKRYGRGARPLAILLTHGHFDHAGSVRNLASYWDVPVHAHPLELPYLTGGSDYPPKDLVVGGALAQMARVFPTSGYNLGSRVRALPDDGSVPHLPGWRTLHVPGHTAGQVALFREADRVLLAADTLTTVNQDSILTMLTMKRELRRPPAPFTTDWEAARNSIWRLAELRPAVIAAGHGVPMTGRGLAARLERFGNRFTPPSRGRYVREPALTNDRGVIAVPPPAPDPLLGVGIGVALAGVVGIVLITLERRRRKD